MDTEKRSSPPEKGPGKIGTHCRDRNDVPSEIHLGEFLNSKNFCKKKRTTIRGQVLVVGDFPKKLVNSRGIVRHSGVILRTRGKRHLVHLGPAWYFWKQDFPIKVGDILEVSGSETSLTGQDRTLMADRVSNQGKTLKIPKKF